MDTEQLTARVYLSQAYRIDQRINSKIGQVQSLRELAERATAAISPTPPSGTRNVHRMEDVVVKMADLEADINADLLQLIDLKYEIVTVIKCVESPELKTLLELRYLSFMTWEEISVELHYDIRHIHRLHGRALDEIEAIRHACHRMS